MGNKPPNWEWFIPPLKIVMTGGWFIIVLPTVFMIYFRTYRPIILNRQITSKYDYAILSSDGAWGLVTHDRSLTSCNVSHSEIPKLPCNTSRPRWIIFWTFELYNHYFWTCCFLFNLPKTCHQGAHAVVAATGYSSLQLAGLHCIWMIWVDDSGKPPGNSGLNIPSCW